MEDWQEIICDLSTGTDNNDVEGKPFRVFFVQLRSIWQDFNW